MDDKEAYSSRIAAEAVGERLGSLPPNTGEHAVRPVATSAGPRARVAERPQSRSAREPAMRTRMPRRTKRERGRGRFSSTLACRGCPRRASSTNKHSSRSWRPSPSVTSPPCWFTATATRHRPFCDHEGHCPSRRAEARALPRLRPAEASFSGVTAGQNDRPADRTVSRDQPARGGCQAIGCRAPVRAACQPSRGNEHRPQPRAWAYSLPMTPSCRKSKARGRG